MAATRPENYGVPGHQHKRHRTYTVLMRNMTVYPALDLKPYTLIFAISVKLIGFC